MYRVQNIQENILRPSIKKYLVYTQQPNVTFLYETHLRSVDKTLKTIFFFVTHCNLIVDIKFVGIRQYRFIKRTIIAQSSS